MIAFDRTTLNPTQAKDYGVHKDLYRGGTLYAIYENGQVFQTSQGMEMLAHTTNMQMNVSSPSAARNTTLPVEYNT